MKNIVYYHSHCMDGLGAAAAHNASIVLNGGTPWNYHPVAYSDFKSNVVPKFIKPERGDRYIFVDFCPPAKTIEYLLEQKVGVLILDHHKTAFDIISSLPGTLLQADMNFFFLVVEKMSGASLVRSLSSVLYNPWAYNGGSLKVGWDEGYGKYLTNTVFHKRIDRSKVDHLYQLLEVYDIHLRDSPLFQSSLHLNAYFKKHQVSDTDPRTFIRDCMVTGFDTMLNEGKLIYETQFAMLEVSHHFAFKKTIDTHSGKTVRVIIGNPPNGTATMFSAVTDKHCQEYQNTVTVAINPILSEKNNGNYSIGFRSRGVKIVDVAGEFGGGGHEHAAGCEYAPTNPSTHAMLVREILEKITRLC